MLHLSSDNLKETKLSLDAELLRARPNPEYCNVKLAIARVMHTCGATDIISEMYGDDDDDDAIVNQPVYMGGPFVSDDILFRKLDDLLLA
jgi:hypothetical protein